MAKLKFNNLYIEITNCDAEELAKVMSIPGVHYNRARTIFKTTLNNIDLVLRMFKGVDVYNPEDPFFKNAPPKIIEHVHNVIQRRSATETLINYGPTYDPGFLMKHQQLGRELSLVNDRYAFFYDTRTGKTPMSLQIIYDDIQAHPGHKWLVLCPLILIENAWLEDAAQFFPDMSVVNLHAPTKAKRLEKFKQDANLYITNIESFVSYQDEVEKLGIHGCFVDESSTMKSNTAKFSKAAVDFAYKVQRWYLLSGTPAPNGEYEYYRQIQSVDYYAIHQSYSQFKLYYFDNKSYNPQYEKLVVKPERKEELNALLRRYSLYVDKEDVLTTPGRDFLTYELDMPADLKKQYNQLRKELYLEIGEGATITAPSEAAKLNKLNQLTSGFAIDTEAMKQNKFAGTDLTEIHIFDEYRFDALEELLETLGDKQAIIWCNYRKEFEIIKQRLGDKCVLVYGAVGIEDKIEAIKKFKNGEAQYFVANPASADKGLTLTNAHIAIYFSMGYSYELYKQSIERIYGDVRKQPLRCTYYIFTAKGTIDEVIYNAVSTKGAMSTAVLNHLKGGQLDVT